MTAIERDGLLGGPDLDLLARLVGLDRGAVIASGGIASLDDIRAVRRARLLRRDRRPRALRGAVRYRLRRWAPEASVLGRALRQRAPWLPDPSPALRCSSMTFSAT